MPNEVFDKDYQFLPKSELLRFEEITRMTRLFVAYSVNKIRLTGGEPLLCSLLANVLLGANQSLAAQMIKILFKNI